MVAKVDEVIGKSFDRVDGRMKVTGAAKYAAEYSIDATVYGVVIQSPIAKGKITKVDVELAMSVPGVIDCYSMFNKPMALPPNADRSDADRMFLFEDGEIHYDGQIIGMVVAKTLEGARHAASLVKFSFESNNEFQTNFEEQTKRTAADKTEDDDDERGNVSEALKNAFIKLEATYFTPAETHNPMEPFASTAVWNDDTLTIYDSTQGVHPARKSVAGVLGLPPNKVRIIAKYIGGGFGCKLTVWSHVILAAMAAKKLKAPVKVVLWRNQMFGPVGFRPATEQRIKLGASKEGKLLAIDYETISETARFRDYSETCSEGAKVLYSCENLASRSRLVKLDIGLPTWMRAPGHAPGSFALESAMDELAYALKMDPIQLRMHNIPETDPSSGLPWSSNPVKKCFEIGSEKFGWSERTSAPRSMKYGRMLVGMGVATAIHSVWRNPASVKVILLADGTAIVQSGSQDIGTGTHTIMTQIAAETLALPFNKVRFDLGDSDLPTAPLSGGSTTSGSVGGAVAQACKHALEKLIALAVKDKEASLYKANKSGIEAANGRLFLTSDAAKADSYKDVLARNGGKLEILFNAKVDDKEDKFSMQTFGAQFAEVRVDPDLGTVHVNRFLGCYGAGRILNPKTARSQMLGGMVWGIGMALTEQTLIDHRFGKIINNDFAEYLIPTHPDIGDLEVIFVDDLDPHVNAIGAKGVGELGITGAAAAIANAVYHATGKRIRDLPITLDKLLS